MIKRWWINAVGENMQLRSKAGGQIFSGDNITINGDVVGGKVFVNGVEQQGMVATPRMTLEIVGGTVGSIETSMDVTCGDVAGDVRAGMGVKCGNIQGSVDAGMGVEAQDIQGSATAGMDVRARDIGRDARAGMSIKCNSIQGSRKSSF